LHHKNQPFFLKQDFAEELADEFGFEVNYDDD